MSNSTNTTECLFDAGMRFECASFFPILLYIIIFYCVIRIAYDCATGGCEPGPIDMTDYKKEKKPFFGVAETWQPGYRRQEERSSSLPEPLTDLRL
jgi:hypothetical protein